MTHPADGPTEMEKRAESLGIKFTRGRTWTSNSLLALETAAFAAEHPLRDEFHSALFKCYFTDLGDIGQVDTLVEIADGIGMDGAALRSALDDHTYRDEVEQGLGLAREIGISSVPTFVIDDQYAVLGAQDLLVFTDLFKRLEKTPLKGVQAE
jgi:predicted DsbA family dithiol-disulfide isomerase